MKLEETLQLTYVAIFFSVTVTGGDNCGLAPFGNCKQNCFKQCKINTANAMNDLEQLETITAEKNICYGKCRGIAYVPRDRKGKRKDIPFSAIEGCLGPCVGNPIPEVCYTGYTALFFYCDCFKCCNKNRDCEDGCHEWHLKPDNPSGLEACKYRGEYNHTITSWCRAFCTWKIITYKGHPANDAPNIIANIAPLCIARCSTFVQTGTTVDYETYL